MIRQSPSQHRKMHSTSPSMSVLRVLQPRETPRGLLPRRLCDPCFCFQVPGTGCVVFLTRVSRSQVTPHARGYPGASLRRVSAHFCSMRRVCHPGCCLWLEVLSCIVFVLVHVTPNSNSPKPTCKYTSTNNKIFKMYTCNKKLENSWNYYRIRHIKNDAVSLN